MLSILVPCHKEENIVKFLVELEEQCPGAEIIVANDRYGKGKGWAMREALSQAKGDFIAFIDGDGDIHPKMLWRLLPFVAQYDVVVGKKQGQALLSRRIITLLSRIYIRMIFGIKVDSQTGIKVFKRGVMPEWRTDSFAFDIEILYNLRHLPMAEVPVEAYISDKMRFHAIWVTFIESLKIRLGKQPGTLR